MSIRLSLWRLRLEAKITFAKSPKKKKKQK